MGMTDSWNSGGQITVPNNLQGEYCLIQYVPDHERREAINVGVILLLPTMSNMLVRTTTSVHRLYCIGEGLPPETLMREIQTFKRHIKNAQKKLFSEKSYYLISNTKYEHFSITTPSIVTVSDPDITIDDLFKKYVDISDGLLVKTIKLLLEKVNENLFVLDRFGPIQEDETVTFTRAKDILEICDLLRDIIDE